MATRTALVDHVARGLTAARSDPDLLAAYKSRRDPDAFRRLVERYAPLVGGISNQSFGHWHYAHLYYSQVMYREGGKDWTEYREKIFKKLLSEVTDDKKQYAYWNQGYIGPVYTAAINLILLQLDKGNLPIYQR